MVIILMIGGAVDGEKENFTTKLTKRTKGE